MVSWLTICLQGPILFAEATKPSEKALQNLAYSSFDQKVCQQAIAAVGALINFYPDHEENYRLSVPIVWSCENPESVASLLEYARKRGVSSTWLEARRLELLYMTGGLAPALEDAKNFEIKLQKERNHNEI